MPILRVIHDKKNPYVVINKDSIWDPSLSLQAVGLLARLISRPDNWQIYVAELAKVCDLSKETINKILRNLIERGYVARIQTKKAKTDGSYKNRFGSYEYWIFETPKTKEEISNILSETVLSSSITDGLDKVAPTKYLPIPSNKKNPPLPPPAEKQVAKETPEEEEEISRRLRERPSTCPPIKSMKSWRKAVLQEIRSRETREQASFKERESHQIEATSRDMTKNLDGELVCAYGKWVEFSAGSKVRTVPYDLPHAEWKNQVRW